MNEYCRKHDLIFCDRHRYQCFDDCQSTELDDGFCSVCGGIYKPPTSSILGSVLKREKLPDQIIKAAYQGRYDDFKSDSPTPIVDLVMMLQANGRNDLADRARNGEWDATIEEANFWFDTEGEKLLERLRRETNAKSNQC